MGNDAGIIWLIGLAIIIALVNFIKEYWVAFAVLAIILLALFFWAGSGKTAETRTVDDLRVQNLVRIFNESADIVETSANIETVDSR